MADAQNAGAKPDETTTQTDGATPEGTTNSGPAKDASDGDRFAAWFEEQTEETQALINDRISGAVSALQKEREQRKAEAKARKAESKAREALEAKLREAASKLEKGSDSRAQLEASANELKAQREAAERQSTFYEGAHESGATNLRLLWIAATDADLVDEKGKADFGKLKNEFPELFKAPPPPPGNAGSGTQEAPPALTGRAAMNRLIRRKAGVA